MARPCLQLCNVKWPSCCKYVLTRANVTDNKEDSPQPQPATTHQRTITLNEIRLPRNTTAGTSSSSSSHAQVTFLTATSSHTNDVNTVGSCGNGSTIITIKQENIANLIAGGGGGGSFVDSTTFLPAPNSPSCSQMVNPSLVQCSTSNNTASSTGEFCK